MEYEKSFLKIITKMVKDFYKNRESYNVIKLAQATKLRDPKILINEKNYFYEEGRLTKNELENLVTDFINENYFNSIETAQKIFLLINNCFNQAIKIYCEERERPSKVAEELLLANENVRKAEEETKQIARELEKAYKKYINASYYESTLSHESTLRKLNIKLEEAKKAEAKAKEEEERKIKEAVDTAKKAKAEAEKEEEAKKAIYEAREAARAAEAVRAAELEIEMLFEDENEEALAVAEKKKEEAKKALVVAIKAREQAENTEKEVTKVYTLYKEMREKKERKKQRKKLTEKIKFYAKGGLVLHMLKNKYLDTIENVAVKKILHNYDQFFKKSDMDFSITIDKTSLSEQEYNQIYKDMSELSYYLLYLIRRHIRYFPTEYSDYHKLNNKYKKKLLEELRKKMNNSNYIKKQIDGSLYVCKLVHNNNYVEEPCNRDITYNFEKKFDTFIVKEDTSLKSYVPSKINNYPNEEVKDYYIIYNNSTDFDINGVRTKIFLARLKSLFSIYIIDSTKCCTFKNLGAEMIDVIITHYDSKQKLDIKNNLTLHKIKNYDSEFNIPTIDYFLKELELIIFNHKYPWADVKWEKRLHRYLFLYIVVLIKSAKKSDLEEFIEEMKELKNQVLLLEIKNLSISSEDNIFKRLKDNINNLIKYINDDIRDTKSNLMLNLNNFISYVSIIIENLLIYDTIFTELDRKLQKPSILLSRQPSNTLSLKESKQKYLKYKNKYISLKNKLKQKGGFNTCNESNSKYILPKIKNVFLNLIDSDVNLTINDRFNQAYKILLNIYRSKNVTSQEFKTYDGEIIHKSEPFTDYTLNITAIAFLSLLIEYQQFLIFYYDPNMQKFNINDNEKHNNYVPIWREPRIYRADISKDNIITMLDKFCIEIDRLFARFMVNLIDKISKFVKNLYDERMEIQELYEKVKKHIIPPIKLKNISRTNNKYEYLYNNWKDRLIEEFKTLNKYEINKIIRDTIELTLNQSMTDNQYTAEATGFFSWMYMVPKKDVNISKKFGSCITMTYLEHYLLHRIFEPHQYINISIEHINRPNPIWEKTRNETKMLVDHWTTGFYFYKKNSPIPYMYRFRSVDTKFVIAKETIDGQVKISGPSKNLFLQLLIYPIFDNYLYYLKKNKEANNITIENYNDKKSQIEKSFTDFKSIL